MTPGIYFHIPFCRTKCSYCHFTSMPFTFKAADAYHKSVLKELNRCVDTCVVLGDINSIYFGGGTPSLIPEENIAELLTTSFRLLPVSGDCEISLEANPETLSANKAAAYRHAGVNRISLGAQSFADEELTFIGRIHTAEMITEAFFQLRNEGFTNINLDLMLGLPGQTRESWRRNLEAAERLEAPHVSVYMLDLDDQCPLQTSVISGSIVLPDVDLVCDLYLESIDFLSAKGYLQYEISNFALPGHACRHNLKYWQREPVYGLGLGSHSFDGQYRFANSSEIDNYIGVVLAGNSPVVWWEKISSEQSLSESLFLGLRLTQGVDLDLLRGKYGSDCLGIYESNLKNLCNRGLIKRNGSIVSLTASGMLLSNEIFQLFV